MTSGRMPVSTDELIGLIYRGPLEVTPWQSFVRALRQRLDVDMAAIALRPGRKDAAPITIVDRRDSETDRAHARAAAAAHNRLALEDPLNRALIQHGGTLTLGEVVPREDLIRTAFYHEVIKPYRIDHQIGMAISEPSGWRSHVGLMNALEHDDFGMEEKAFLEALRPHLECALEIHARLVRTESERDIYEDALERMAIATFVLDQRGRIISTNRLAHRQLEEGHDFLISHGRLGLRGAVDNERLHKILRDGVAWCERSSDKIFVEAMRILGADDKPYGLLIRGIQARDYHRSDVVPGIIVYASHSDGSLTPEPLIGQLFGLTPAEARVAVLLANGLNLAQIAEKVGITEKTARSYSKQAFTKTGVNRQADLVRLLLTSVAMLSGAEGGAA